MLKLRWLELLVLSLLTIHYHDFLYQLVLSFMVPSVKKITCWFLLSVSKRIISPALVKLQSSALSLRRVTKASILSFPWISLLKLSLGLLNVGSQCYWDIVSYVFFESIKNKTRCNVVAKIKCCLWYSVWCDGSTYCTCEDIEVVFLCTCSQNQIEDMFWHLESLKSSSSEYMFQFLMKMNWKEITNAELGFLCQRCIGYAR